MVILDNSLLYIIFNRLKIEIRLIGKKKKLGYEVFLYRCGSSSLAIFYCSFDETQNIINNNLCKQIKKLT